MDEGQGAQFGNQPSPPYSGGGSGFNASGKVSGPAIGLMITAGVGIACQLLGIVMRLVGFSLASMMGAEAGGGHDMPWFATGALSAILGGFSILIGLIILFGAVQMKSLSNYGLAMTVSILAMIPCISPCCLLGIPIGIWALVVLLDSNVKAAFR